MVESVMKSTNFRIGLVLSGLTVVAFAAGLSLGSGGLAVFDRDNPLAPILLKLRLCRTLTAFIVGGALSVAGLIYQAVLRNPLAEPFVLGVSGGAGLAAVAAVWSGLTLTMVWALPAAALGGALLALAVVWLIAGREPPEFSNNALLAGVIVSSLASSGIMFFISTLGMRELNSITWWLLGNLQGGNWPLLWFGGTTVIILAALLTWYGRAVDLLTLGSELAHNFGLPPRRASCLLLLAASLLAAVTVAMAGIIGFIGLIVPHILRRLFGVEHRLLIPAGMAGGGAFLIFCDTLARLAYPAQELPVGVITALLGGPFFIWLLRRGRQ